MKIRVHDVMRVKREKVADGDYDGKWSGIEVRFTANGVEYFGHSTTAVKGRNEPCVVTIKKGKATVSEK